MSEQIASELSGYEAEVANLRAQVERLEEIKSAARDLVDEISTRGTHERWKNLANALEQLIHDKSNGDAA